jgi:hypothetical protein
MTTHNLPNAIIFQNVDGEAIGTADTRLAALWANALAFRLATFRHSPDESQALIVQAKHDTGTAWQFIAQCALQFMTTQVLGTVIGEADIAYFAEVERGLLLGAAAAEAELNEYQASLNAPDDLDS